MAKRRLTLAFWNLSNLFEVGANERAPASKAELDAKLDRVAETLRSIGGEGGPPALIGLAEVATERLVKRIARALRRNDKRRTAWVWLPPADATAHTGIALLYDVKTIAQTTLLNSRGAGGPLRPWILWAECHVANAGHAPLYVAVNHWKSRLHGGGRAERAQAGQWLEGTVANLPRSASVIAVGDFNDEPFDHAVRVSLLARRSHAGVLEPLAKGRLFNTAWSWLSESDAYAGKVGPTFRPRRPHTTHGTSSPPLVFDQVLVSGAMLEGVPFALDEGSVRMHAPPEIARPVRHGRLVPEPWAWHLTSRRGEGASNHFPVAADVTY